MRVDFQCRCYIGVSHLGASLNHIHTGQIQQGAEGVSEPMERNVRNGHGCGSIHELRDKGGIKAVDGLLYGAKERPAQGLISLSDIEQTDMIAAVETFDGAAGGSFSSWYSLYMRREVRNLMGWRSRPDPKTGESVTVISDAMAHASSLDAPIGEESDGYTVQDTIPDTEDQYEDADRRIFNEQLHNALDDALGTLPDEESTAIRGTFYDGFTLRNMFL